MSRENRNWRVIDTGQEIMRCLDGSLEDVLEALAKRYGSDWAYGNAVYPPRFDVLPLQLPDA